MRIPPEIIAAQLVRRDCDEKLCVHEAKSRALTYSESDGSGQGWGVICRLIGHNADGDLITLDVVIEGPTAISFAENLFSSVLDLPGLVGRSAPNPREEGS